MAHVFERNIPQTIGQGHCPKISWTLVHKRLKTGPEILSGFRGFCILLRCQELHTEVSKRGPTKLCQMEGGKWSWCEPYKVAPHSECKCNHRNLVAGVACHQKHYKLAMASGIRRRNMAKVTIRAPVLSCCEETARCCTLFTKVITQY